MSTGLLHTRTDALLRRLVRRGTDAALVKLIRSTGPEDLTAAMEHLTWAEQRRLHNLIEDEEYAAEVLANLSEESAQSLLQTMSEDRLGVLLDHLEPDDAVDVLGMMGKARQQAVLEEMEDSSSVVRQLLEWPEDTAGGIMSPKVFAVDRSFTCGDAIASLQVHHSEVETVYYVYVVDERNRLLGVTSLRGLLTHPPSTPVVEIMTDQVVNVPPHADQEEVARFVARYDLVAIPVVAADGQLLGIVTVDDVVDVIREEAEEDMMLMAGVADVSTRGVFSQAKHRAGWLLATIGGGVLAAEIISSYEETLLKVAVLAGFIPVIMGMGGNVGIQSATLAVRGLATGRIQLGGLFPFLYMEARVGVLLGLFYAALLGSYGLLRFPERPLIGVSLACSIFLAISSAGVIGASLPVAFQRVGADPAVATGPFVTTIVDLLGIVIYFNVARWLLGL